MFCHNCGNQIADGSKFCYKCGAAQQASNVSALAQTAPSSNPLAANPFADPIASSLSLRDSNSAALLSLFLGTLGFHDFYCGNTQYGVIKLILTITGIGFIFSVIWNIIDLYNIGDGSYMDGDGRYLKEAPWARFIVILQILLSIGFVILIFTRLSNLLALVK